MKSFKRKTKREIAFERRRLYKAECVLKEASEEMTLAQCQRYVRQVMDSEFVKSRFEFCSVVDENFDPVVDLRCKVRVKDGRGRKNVAWASYDWYGDGRATISLPKWARNQFVILHEISHHLHPVDLSDLDNWDHFDHDGRFAYILLQLVKEEMGRASYNKLRDSFREHEVRVQRFHPKIS